MQLWVGEGQCSEAFRLSAVGERSSSVQHFAAQGADGRVATVSVEAMRFLRPVSVGDKINCDCLLAQSGKTSVAVRIKVWTDGHTD